MFILTTLNNNYPKIWEQSTKASFSSKFEEKHLVNKINQLIENNEIIFAVGVYRWTKPEEEGQDLAPSLLAITKAEFIPSQQLNKQDIYIYFSFLQKLPLETNKALCDIKHKATPLIKEVNEEKLLRTINISKNELILLYQSHRAKKYFI